MKANTYIKHNRNINKTGLLSAFTFLLLALTCLFPISKSEQTTEAVTGTVQSSSLTLNVSSSAASVELDVNSTEGTFASSTTDNSANFSVTTNNFSGYTLSISGSNNDGKLYDTTKKYFLEPLTSAVSEADFSSTSSLNGKWGYKPSKFNSVANANYLPAPTTTASTLDTTSVANTTANNYTISLGLRADYTTTADTYSNSFVITAVPNPIAYVITYDANTTDTISNMPASQNSTTSATEITLSDKTPAREGYDFKGWCTVAPTTANPDTCTGTTFQPGDIYGIDQTSENITVLYAIWKEQIAGYIQDYTYAQCEANAQNHAVKVIDKRDDKVYTARYINGLCTMTQNLDLELTTGMTLSPDTTNVTANRTLGTVGSLTSGNSYDEMRILHSSTSGYGTYYNYAAATLGTITGSSNSTEATQDICPKGWRLPAGGNTSTGYEQKLLTNNVFGSYQAIGTFDDSFKVAAGRYYNGSLTYSGTDGRWWSSTADDTANRYNLYYNTSNGLYSGSSGRRYVGYSVRCVKAKPGVTISFNANGGTGTMNMQKIDAGQSANLTANTFTRTDYVFTGWNTEPDGSGTSYSDQANYTAPASEDNKIVVLYAQWKGATMQTYTAAQCQADASSQAVTVKDARDNKTYTVRYINGNCWMTQNLRLAAGTTLTPSDTNIASAYTLPNNDLALGNSYVEARLHDSGNTDNGYWYNYCAASAGTICTESNSTDAIYDICPAGWHLPTLTDNRTIGGTSVRGDSTYTTVFSPITGGRYYDGSLTGAYGYWWSSTRMGGTGRRYLANQGAILYSYFSDASDLYSRYNGYYIRCIRSA